MSATIADQVRILLKERIPFDLHAYKHLTFGRDLVKSLLDAYDAVVVERDELRAKEQQLRVSLSEASSLIQAAEGEERSLRDEVMSLRAEVFRLQEKLDRETTAARLSALYKQLSDEHAARLKAEQYAQQEMCRSDMLARDVADLRVENASLREQLARSDEVCDVMARDVEDVHAENASLTERLKAAQSTALATFSQELVRLREMEGRVKDGRLTENEFQAICHNLSPDDEERFIEGCYATWQKLFKKVELRRVAAVLGIRSEDLGVSSCSSGLKGGELGSVSWK